MVTRRGLLRAGFFFGAGMLGAPMLNLGRTRLWGADGPSVPTRVLDLVVGTTVIDMMGLLTLDWAKLVHWQSDASTFGEPEFRRLEASGVNLFHPAVETSARDPREGVLRWLARWDRLLDSRPCFLARVGSLADLLQACRQGRLGVLIGFQNSTHLRSAADVELFHRLGQRVSQLTYNEANLLGSGCYVARDSGLTALGGAVVGAMNRTGMVIDISHCGERTGREAIAQSTKPVLVTHSNCRALAPHPRCKSDEAIRLMAASGGVMGITVVRGYVGGRDPSIERVLDHFDHVARLVGVEHVGLGSDVDLDGLDSRGRPAPSYRIRGLDLPRRVFQLAEGLLRRGYRDADVALILGGNFARALSEIWSGDPWLPASELLVERDPFCPAPDPRGVGAQTAV